jgi:hypothetical protein
LTFRSFSKAAKQANYFLKGKEKGRIMKKKMRRLLFVILAAITALAMSAPAFAATIKISNGHKGQTYTAYKLLNYDTKTESGETKITSYYLTETE